MDLEQRARAIRLVCTDVDGALTNGELHYGDGAWHGKSFHVRDGLGIKLLQKAGIPVAIISGLESPATRQRALDLGITDCFMGHLAKKPILDQLCARYGLGPEAVAHLGDDLNDLALLTRVGLACCPEDAVAEVRAAAHWVAPVQGGRGAFRALAELILKAQGRWDELLGSYNG